MEHRLLELRVHRWREVVVLWVEELGLVLEVMQRLQRVLHGWVLELMLLMLMVVGVVVMLLMMLEVMVMVVVVVVIHDLLVHVMDKLLGLVFEELLKLLGGFFVCHEPVLSREEE